ncbi:hypothetical protein SEMRO_809_G205550.1 [Seminavis robusta]|uniref:Uncharacterized protein n=1 Tax=Seminavis robusta TaxID=568900 RepID=A0A9N8E8R7_9STRA|nr:hypothetical protein SEMRO_809_G205550.1 [Seminavis robusta]|eukprot:Sro809_g205550.1 n/a (152) ;mRNA; f:10704-11159
MASVSWQVVAAVSEEDGKQRHAKASFASVDLLIGDRTVNYSGPVALQRFGNHSLFRIVVLNEQGTRNTVTLNLPPDVKWIVESPKKVISPITRTKAIKSVVRLPVGNPEGFEKVTITMIWNGEQGSSNVFAQAMIFASSVVVEAITPAVSP